jgi:hypothetical protein
MENVSSKHHKITGRLFSIFLRVKGYVRSTTEKLRRIKCIYVHIYMYIYTTNFMCTDIDRERETEK